VVSERVNVQIISVVVDMDGVVRVMNIVLLAMVVNLNLANVLIILNLLKENVEKNMVNVRKVNVVVNMAGVVKMTVIVE